MNRRSDMKRICMMTLVLLLVGFSALAVANDVCKKELANPNTIGQYLTNYYLDCSQDAAIKSLKQIKITPESKENKIYKQGWQMVEKKLGDLLTDDLQEDWNKTLGQIKARAVQAQKDFDTPPSDDISNLGRANHWDIDTRLELPAIKNPAFDLIDLKSVIQKVCNSEGAKCQETLKRSKQLINTLAFSELFGKKYSSTAIKNIQTELKIMSEKWNVFFYDSKSMYPWDITFTDLVYKVFAKENRSTYTDGFRNPPEWQFFILHPSAAFEYVDAAEDGEQLKPAVYAELIGANRWEKGFLGLTGLSAIISYSDRKDVSDVGWGGLLTFDNVYSLGVTTRSGDIGVFVSLDLANLFREKIKPSWNKYKNLSLSLGE